MNGGGFIFKYSLTILLALVSTCFASLALGQHFNAKLTIPKEMLANTTFSLLDKVDSLSKKKDSLSASSTFQEVDPYHLFWMGQTPTTIDTFLSMYNITSSGKMAYKQKFVEAFNSERSSEYLMFQKMYEEDQDIRWKLDKCADSISCEKLHGKMYLVDSGHFHYLNNYIAKKGWPTIKNGSLYAQTIALHNHAVYQNYLQIFRNAVIKGDLPVSFYYLVLDYISLDSNSCDRIVNEKRKFGFDVSSILQNKMIDSSVINEIINKLKEHCPVKMVAYILETQSGKGKFDLWFNEKFEEKSEYKRKMLDAIDDIIWSKGCQPIDNAVYHSVIKTYKKTNKLKLYILY